MEKMKDIASNVFDGNTEKVRELVAAALGSGTKAENILNNGLIIGMDSVGDKFKTKDMYLPEVILAGEAMKAGMQLIKPFLPQNAIAFDISAAKARLFCVSFAF